MEAVDSAGKEELWKIVPQNVKQLLCTARLI